jgi:hypothetical protein
MRPFTLRTVLVVAVAAALVAVTGTAIAASTGSAGSPSAFLDSLAKHLGISREKLDEATKAAAIDQVDALLEAGRITEEQADAMKERIRSGEGMLFGWGRGPGPWGHKGADAFGNHLSAAAEYLGLDEDELRTRLADGKSLKEIAEAEGKSVDGLEKAIVADAKERLADAVKDGKLTEEQAAAMAERIADRVDELVEGTLGRGHGLGGFHWRDGGDDGRELWGGPHTSGTPSSFGTYRPVWGVPA